MALIAHKSSSFVDLLNQNNNNSAPPKNLRKTKKTKVTEEAKLQSRVSKPRVSSLEKANASKKAKGTADPSKKEVKKPEPSKPGATQSKNTKFVHKKNVKSIEK